MDPLHMDRSHHSQAKCSSPAAAAPRNREQSSHVLAQGGHLSTNEILLLVVNALCIILPSPPVCARCLQPHVDVRSLMEGLVCTWCRDRSNQSIHTCALAMWFRRALVHVEYGCSGFVVTSMYDQDPTEQGPPQRAHTLDGGRWRSPQTHARYTSRANM